MVAASKSEIAQAKQLAAASLVHTLEALRAHDAAAARVLVGRWRESPAMWRALAAGITGDLEEITNALR